MSFFKSIGEIVGKGLRDIAEAPIDMVSGVIDGVQKGGLFDSEEPKDKQSTVWPETPNNKKESK